MPSFLYQLIRWPSDGAPSMELQQSGFLKGSSGLGTILSIKYTSVTFLLSLEENVNSSMDNAHHPLQRPGSMTSLCFSDTIFYCIFVLPFHTTGHQWVLPVCLAPTHLSGVPLGSFDFRTVLFQPHLHKSHGTYSLNLSHHFFRAAFISCWPPWPAHIALLNAPPLQN